MAKAKGSKGGSVGSKMSFGQKSSGKAKKKYGPKEQKPKKYVGQGR
jgi:hypothetical protein